MTATPPPPPSPDRALYRLPVIAAPFVLVGAGLALEALGDRSVAGPIGMIVGSLAGAAMDPAVFCAGLLLGFIPGRYIWFLAIASALALAASLGVSFYIADFQRLAGRDPFNPTMIVLRGFAVLWLAHITNLAGAGRALGSSLR